MAHFPTRALPTEFLSIIIKIVFICQPFTSQGGFLLNIDHLYYFSVIADTKSINQASRRLFVSQQHLSRIVSALEDELHTKLLRRASTGIELTEKGEVFLNFAQKIVADYREMQSYFYLEALPDFDQSQSVQGSCKITLPFFFSLFLNDFIGKLSATYPALTISCFEDADGYNADELYASDMLHLLLLDITNHDLSNTDSKLVFYEIGHTTASCCVNRTSALAHKSVLTSKDIANARQTIYPAQSKALHGVQNILFISSNIYQHLDSVVHNQSVCIIPTYIRSGIYAAYPDIVLIPYEKQMSIPIYLVHSSRHTLQIADKAVIRFVAQYIQKLNS